MTCSADKTELVVGKVGLLHPLNLNNLFGILAVKKNPENISQKYLIPSKKLKSNPNQAERTEVHVRKICYRISHSLLKKFQKPNENPRAPLLKIYNVAEISFVMIRIRGRKNK